MQFANQKTPKPTIDFFDEQQDIRNMRWVLASTVRENVKNEDRELRLAVYLPVRYTYDANISAIQPPDLPGCSVDQNIINLILSSSFMFS